MPARPPINPRRAPGIPGLPARKGHNDIAAPSALRQCWAMVGRNPPRLPALQAWPIAIASLRLFQRAPRASAALWALSIPAGLLLDDLGTGELLASARAGANASRLSTGCGAVLAGWAASCIVQSLWAQLVFEAHRPQGVASIAHACRRLGGAWTRLGLLATYAVGAILALYWPLLARQLQQPSTTSEGWIIAAGVVVVAAWPVLWLTMRLGLMVPAAAMYSLSTWAAVLASWRLTRGRVLLLLRISALIALPPWALGLARALLSLAPGSALDVALRAGQVGLGAVLDIALPLFTLVAAEPPASGADRDGARRQATMPSP